MDVPPTNLGLWYARWLKFRDWKARQRKYGDRAFYEICAIRERHSVTSLCYVGSYNNGDYAKMESELRKCKKISPRDVSFILDDIIENLREMDSVVSEVSAASTASTASTVPPINKTNYHYLEFKPIISQDVAAWLQKYDPRDVVELLLRYECLCPQGQQWAVPKSWLESIKAEYGLDLIAFASPINKGVDAPYCSGYTEDKRFGSLGSVFKLGPDWIEQFSLRRCTIEINPPFIEQILSDAASFVEGLLRRAAEMRNPPKITILYIGPDWTDADFYTRITERISGVRTVTVRPIKLVSGTYSYENSEGKTINTSQSSWLFVITNYYMVDVKLKEFIRKHE